MESGQKNAIHGVSNGNMIIPNGAWTMAWTTIYHMPPFKRLVGIIHENFHAAVAVR